MEQTTQQISSENPSLLMLNDDCLRDIFKFLELKDSVHLGETCTRLLCVAKELFKKYKRIEVRDVPFWSELGSSYTMQELSHILSIIGEHVQSVKVGRGDLVIHKTIADNCTNLSSVDLKLHRCVSYGQGPLSFRNLKELKVKFFCNCIRDDRSQGLFRHCIKKGLSLCNSTESLHSYSPNPLPSLRSLTANDISYVDVDYLACLPSKLTKFTFESDLYENTKFATELLEKLNLVELNFCCEWAEDVFAILKYFRHLERLSVISEYFPFGNEGVPENTTFPSKLKQIRITGFPMSCSLFSSMIKQLKFFEEYDGRIFWDSSRSEYFPCPRSDLNASKIIARIDDELREEKRKFKMIVPDDGLKDNKVFKYSDNLDIICRQQVERTFDHSSFDHLFILESFAANDISYVDVDYLARLPSKLTKFTFESDYYENTKFVTELPEKLNLVELNFRCEWAEDVFAILKYFQHLERLSVLLVLPKNIVDPFFVKLSREVPENTTFPSKLKKLKLDGMKMSCNLFSSMIKQLKFFEEFDGRIFWDSSWDSSWFSVEYFPCPWRDINASKIIARIDEELRVEKRKFKMIVPDDDLKENEFCKYSDNLDIVFRQQVKRTFDYSFQLDSGSINNVICSLWNIVKS